MLPKVDGRQAFLKAGPSSPPRGRAADWETASSKPGASKPPFSNLPILHPPVFPQPFHKRRLKLVTGNIPQMNLVISSHHVVSFRRRREKKTVFFPLFYGKNSAPTCPSAFLEVFLHHSCPFLVQLFIIFTFIVFAFIRRLKKVMRRRWVLSSKFFFFINQHEKQLVIQIQQNAGAKILLRIQWASIFYFSTLLFFFYYPSILKVTQKVCEKISLSIFF